MTRLRSIIGLGISVGLCFGAAFVGSIFTTPAIPGWYAALIKPSWTPPAWVFGPVWSILYLMMALAAWLVWRQARRTAAVTPLTLFFVQLALNALWSILFFGLRMPAAAFAEILVLWLAILATMIAFWRLTSPAGYLLLPYLVWVTFAAGLNLAIWRMNAAGPG